MILVDKNGITFNSTVIPTQNWENQDVPYIIWFEPNRLSCMLNYVMAIRVIAEYNENLTGLSVDLGDSSVFSIIQENIIETNTDNILVPVNNIVGSLNSYAGLKSKLLVVDPEFPTIKKPFVFPLCQTGKNNISHVLFTVYILGRHTMEETVLKNIKLSLISGDNIIDSTVVRIGATFYDESEELKVIGRNMGVRLPADICKAFWNCGYTEYYPDKKEQREKLKELLFNYMGIRGECGNYSSAINSLKWFGWGDHVQLRQLISLNNNIPDLYISSEFNNSTNLRNLYKDFRRTTFLSLTTQLKEPVNEIPEIYYGETEGSWDGIDTDEKPEIESEDSRVWKWAHNIFEENKIFTDKYIYSDKYIPGFDERYSYVMTELALKLACLSSFYEEYLLPVQLNVVNSSVVDHVSSAPLKLLSGTYRHTTVTAENVTPHDIRVNFNNTVYTVYQNGSDSYIDIAFDVTKDDTEEPTSGSAVIYLSTNKCLVWRKFGGWDNGHAKYSVNLSKINENPLEINHLSVLIDGTWYETDIRVRYPEFKIEAGRLIYRYDTDALFEMKEPGLVTTMSREVLNKEAVSNSWWDNSGIHIVSSQKFGIPMSKKNLVINADLMIDNSPIEDLCYRVDSLAASRYPVHLLTGQVQYSILDNYEYFPGSLYPGITVYVQDDNISEPVNDFESVNEVDSTHISGIIAIDINTGLPMHETVEPEAIPQDVFKSTQETIKNSDRAINGLIYKKPAVFNGNTIEYALKITESESLITFDYIPDNVDAEIFIGGAGTIKVSDRIYNILGNQILNIPSVETDFSLEFDDIHGEMYFYACRFKSPALETSVFLEDIAILDNVTINIENNSDVSNNFDVFLMKNIEYSLSKQLSQISKDIDMLLGDNIESVLKFRQKYRWFTLPPITETIDNIEITSLVRAIAERAVYTLENSDQSIFLRVVDNSGEYSVLAEVASIKQQIQRLMEYIRLELQRINNTSNASSPYFISAVSKYPIGEIEELSNFEIPSISQDVLINWLQTPYRIKIDIKGICTVIDKNIDRSVLWSPERYIFIPNTIKDGWMTNIFHKEELAACRIIGETENLPYFSEENNRFEFKHSSPGADSKEETFVLGGRANVVILGRSNSLDPYPETGCYDVEYAYTWGTSKNILIKKPGFIEII